MDSPTSLKKEWVLTREALDSFLAKLDRDRDRAGQKYEGVRLRLLKYFQWSGAAAPDIEADETINRVARKIEEGENVHNLNAYIYGVARLVSAESRKTRAQSQQLADETETIEASRPDENDSDVGERRACFGRCLEALPDKSRKIVTEYYQYEQGKKIEHRKQLAARLGITLNALRISAHRIRSGLETCVRKCLKHSE